MKRQKKGGGGVSERWMHSDGSSTCFQITTKTMSEMMTMTRSTNTAAATVSSG